MKYLIAGLGNVGAEYQGTRHNIGFMVADALAKQADAPWSLERRAYRTEYRLRGRTVVIIKPTTYMNLSGEAVRYWLQAERIPLSNLLVVVDDIALPLGTTDYCRLRIGVGNNFGRGQQIDYVLGTFTPDEEAVIQPRIETACKAVETFVTLGPDRAMNSYNK